MTNNSQKPTSYQLKVLKDILFRQKGWPVGIAVPAAVAKRLVDKQLAQWTVPFIPMHLLKTSRKLSSISCTVTGELYAKDILQ